jgi:hypothetical protein
MTNGVSGVTSRLGPSAGSRGPLPRECPIARSSTTSPSRRRQSAIAGCMPLR